ncbi:MAG: hypothetical protein J7M25_09770 [Deltaproteobacteria bacterium]|nr:hypothetical protein [Deltaproteobacteria bacterium]
MKSIFTLSLAAIFSTSLIGCKVMLGNGQSRASKISISVPFPPPHPKKEQQPQRIKPGHFWVGGYWEWLDIANSYRWRRGHFVKARKNWEYRYPRYRKVKGRWYFIKPHWRRRRTLARPPAPRQVHAVSQLNIKPPPVKKGAGQEPTSVPAAASKN